LHSLFLLNIAGAPIIFLSGSFRIDWESAFQEAFGPGIPILREPSVVPSTTEYHVQLLPSGNTWKDCQNACVTHIQQQEARMANLKCMVFVPLVWQVDDTAQQFKRHISASSIFTYKVSDQPASQISAYETWQRKATLSILVCTHAGAVGIDPPSIVRVYHLGAVWSVVSMFQAAGRSGRGSHGFSTFITSDNVLRTFFKNNDVNGIEAQQIQGITELHDNRHSLSRKITTDRFADYIFTRSCKRRWLSKYFDSFQSNPCLSFGSMCSSCAGKTLDNSIPTLIKTAGVPCDPMTTSREATALASARDCEHQAHALLRIFNMFASTKQCALCLIFANTKRQHDLGKCPLMCTSAGTLDIKCYRCAGSHRINQCLVPNRMTDGTFCYFCCCVFKVKTVQLHMPGHCEHGAKDTLFISCWYAKRNQQMLRIDFKHKYVQPFEFEDAAFFAWLLQEDNGLQNSLRMFGDLMDWNWRFGNY
jgi:hypothetical protein